MGGDGTKPFIESKNFRMRADGWEARLVQLVKRARVEPFHSRRWNCARFAHAAREAIAGRQLPFERGGRGSLEMRVDRILARVPAAYACRGDVVLADVPLPALGVCLGARSAFLGRDGLVEIPTLQARAAWKVD